MSLLLTSQLWSWFLFFIFFIFFMFYIYNIYMMVWNMSMYGSLTLLILVNVLYHFLIYSNMIYDSTTSLLSNISSVTWAKWLHSLKCGELSEYTDSAHTEMEDLSSRYMNWSDVCIRCGHDNRQLHPSCTAYRRTVNLTGPAWHNEACSRLYIYIYIYLYLLRTSLLFGSCPH